MSSLANLRLRFAAFLLDYLIIAAYIILLTSKTHQTLYDRIAGSYVVMAPHPSSRFTSIK